MKQTSTQHHQKEAASPACFAAGSLPTESPTASSSLTEPYPAPSASPLSHAPAPPSFKRSLLDFRMPSMGTALGVTLLCALGGGLLTASLSPTTEVATALAAHIPSPEADPWLVFLRVCLSSLPIWAMLSLSGLCTFGPACALLLLCFSGWSQGTALATLLIARDTAPSLLLPAFLLLTFVRVGAHAVLFVSVRTTSAGLSDPTCQLSPGQRGLSPLMLRHLTVALATGLALSLSNGLYTVALFAIAS